MPDFDIVDAQGRTHRFPEGMDPKKAAAIVRQQVGGQSYHPGSGTLVQGRQSLAQGNRDDTPMGTAESMGRSMFQSAANPQSAGDMASLATGTPQIGESGVIQSLIAAMKGAPGMVRTASQAVRSRLPSMGSVGRGLETAGDILPSALDPARPLRSALTSAGQSLQEAEAARPSPNAMGGTTPPRQMPVDSRPTWLKPVAENAPDSIYARGGTTPAPSVGPDFGRWTKPTAEGLPDSANATGTIRPVPPSPGPLGQTAFSGQTNSAATANLVPINSSWKQGPLPAHKTGGSGAHATIEPHSGPSRIIKPGPESEWLFRDVSGGGAVNPKDQQDLIRQYLMNFMRSSQ